MSVNNNFAPTDPYDRENDMNRQFLAVEIGQLLFPK